MTKTMTNTLRIAIGDIPAQGIEIIVEDPDVWNLPIQELHVDCTVKVPLRVVATLTSVQGGVLVRGKLTGEVVQTCDVCAEDAPVIINHSIDTFEAIPGESIPFEHAEDDQNEDLQNALEDHESHVIIEKNIPFLHMDSLCWEEFMLALPMRPLCQDGCKGICPECGQNLNEKTCACAKDEGDPRLAALRALKIAPK